MNQDFAIRAQLLIRKAIHSGWAKTAAPNPPVKQVSKPKRKLDYKRTGMAAQRRLNRVLRIIFVNS